MSCIVGSPSSVLLNRPRHQILENCIRACLKYGQPLTQKMFMLSPFKNWRFWFPYILNFWQKNPKEIKKSWILVNSWCFCLTFYANLMSDVKKKRLKFLFITPLILLINMSMRLFRWTVKLIKTEKFIVTPKTKNQTLKFFSALFNNRYKFIIRWKYRS